jgi:hypothetical protein
LSAARIIPVIAAGRPPAQGLTIVAPIRSLTRRRAVAASRPPPPVAHQRARAPATNVR